MPVLASDALHTWLIALGLAGACSFLVRRDSALALAPGRLRYSVQVIAASGDGQTATDRARLTDTPKRPRHARVS